VLAAGVGLVITVLIQKNTPEATATQVFTAVGVLFGLLAAGGLGGLFATNAAETAATSAAKEVAPKAAAAADQVSSEVSEQVSTEVPKQVENALEAEAGGGGK
jgi:hypothetical protein